jgi:HTH-type transcriptional repressor of NAD biosynthesis genes
MEKKVQESGNYSAMKKGLMLGKFMPPHLGHLSLIEFGATQCEHLIVLVCATDKEPINGKLRHQWMKEICSSLSNITIEYLHYSESELPNTSESSEKVSAIWVKVLQSKYPDIDCFISSEKYGDYVAACMNIKHIPYDINRERIQVSASLIRNNPLQYWELLPKNVQPYFLKKIALVGSESTGKSTIAEKLATYFNTAFVPEVARDIVAHTESCTFDDLNLIAEHHAKAIEETISKANKLLFIDTDINITKSYSRFLFGRELMPDPWIENMNHCDLYLFLETDCPYVQDGTRLAEKERNRLSDFHKQQLELAGIEFILVTGNWEARYTKAIKIISQYFFRAEIAS